MSERAVPTAPTTVAFPHELEAERDPRRPSRWWIEIDGLRVALSNLDKPYWRPEGYTKADLVAYYANIAPWALPYVRDRPLTMKRMPGGVDESFFYAKQVPSHAPAWVTTAAVRSLDSDKTIDYVLAQDAATLLWLANLGCVELHPWHARVDDLAHPDYAFFDLDPMGADFATVRGVALLVRDACQHLGLRSYPRTSGATGMQVYVPLARVHTASAVTEWVGRVCAAIHRADPERTTMTWQVAERPVAVFLDHRMNTEGKNIAGTYSLRPERGATLAAPLTWEEVEADASPQDFTIETIWSRLEAVGDLFAPVLAGGQDLRHAMRAMGMDPDEPREPGHAVGSISGAGGRTRAAGTPPPAPGAAPAPPAPRSAPAAPDPDRAPARGQDARATPVEAPAPRLAPMLATAVTEPFDDPGWVFEVKWDGVRAIATVVTPTDGGAGATQLVSRQGNDISGGYPELAGLWERVRARTAVLDGEIVAFDAAGLPSFQRLQQRMHLRGEGDVERARQRVPVTYVVFDVLAVDGEPLVDLPLSGRLERLDALVDPAPPLRLSERFIEDGCALYAAAEQRGLEGIMGKRLASRYRPGARSPDWRKIKVRRRATAVIGGWLPGSGGRRGDLGALLVGWHDAGALRFAGRVGTGFDGAERRRLLERLGTLEARAESPFAGAPRLPEAVWVAPELVCAVEYGELTDAGKLRAPAYKGLVAADPATCTRPA